jgi:DNA polymerase
MPAMSDAYHQLLEATIQHLQDLKAGGDRFVPVAAETLAALARPPARAAAPLKPAPVSASPSTLMAKPKTSLPIIAPAPAPVSATPPLDAAGKAAAIAELRAKVLACVKCPNLVKARKTVVFGVGNPNAELMFVGEAPGADEDAQGEPFVGLAGQTLNKIIAATGLKREDVFIGNILKCRPDTPGQSAGNRKPTPAEMQICIPWLLAQIDIIRPKVLVALGATAVEGLLGKTGISKLRGNWQSYRGIPLMPTYHPAYLLRNQALSEKRKVWEDMLQVMEKLGLPISTKQRNFFLAK